MLLIERQKPVVHRYMAIIGKLIGCSPALFRVRAY